jgi:hypothetical protein
MPTKDDEPGTLPHFTALKRLAVRDLVDGFRGTKRVEIFWKASSLKPFLTEPF